MQSLEEAKQELKDNDDVVERILEGLRPFTELENDMDDWDGWKAEAKTALTSLLKEAEAKGYDKGKVDGAIEPQEHYSAPLVGSGGTASRCACGRLFPTSAELQGHIDWQLARLTTLKEHNN